MLAKLLLSSLFLAQCSSNPFLPNNSTFDRNIVAHGNAICDNMFFSQYADSEGKNFLDLAAASYNSPDQESQREKCFAKAYPSYKFKTVDSMLVPCDKLKHECQAFIARSDSKSTFVISFRGTEGLGQLLDEAVKSLESYIPYSDGYSSATASEYGSVNTYFYYAMNTLWDQMIVPNVEKFPGYTYFITGHSLGGALAAMTAFRLSARGYTMKSNIRMISFGEPRVGDFIYAKHYPCLVPYSYRVVHSNDPIPHLPPLDLFNKRKAGNPYHHTREVWYSKKFDSFKMCDSTDGEDTTCSDKENVVDYATAGPAVHLHYFNHFISKYGLDGCSATSRLPITISVLLAIAYALFF